MRKFIILIVLLFTIGMTGCKSWTAPENPDSNPVVDSFVEENTQIGENIEETVEVIGDETENIDQQTQNINENIEVVAISSDDLESNLNLLQDLAPQIMALTNNNKEIMGLIYGSIDAIKLSVISIDDSNDSIIQSNEAIKAERQELKNVIKDIENQKKRAERIQNEINKKDKVIKSQIERIDELEDDIESASTKYLGMLIAFGVIIMVLGVLGFFYNFKVGIAMLGIGGLTVAVTAATMYYMGWFAIIGLVIMGGGLLLLFGYLGWALFRGRTFAKATVENAEFIETIKQELPADKTFELFGDRVRPGLAQILQSKSTQREVEKIRRNVLKPKMENTISRVQGDLVVMDGVVYQKINNVDPNSSQKPSA